MPAADDNGNGFAGLVLAGGQSRRFGREKALAELAGTSLLDWAVINLQQVTQTIAVSARKGSQAEMRAAERGLPVLHDRAGHGQGPLAGLCAGLVWARENHLQWLFTLPCDVPSVPAYALAKLAAARGEDAGSYAVTKRGSENLCALWPVTSLAILEGLLAHGNHPSVRDVLQRLNAKPVFFEGEDLFLNVNTPADLAQLETILRGRAGSYRPESEA